VNTHAIDGPAPGTLGQYQVREVGVADPFRWIGDGIRDFRRAPGKSLIYGALFAAACAATCALTLNWPWFTLAYLTGLLVLGPYLAAGLYIAARQMQAGEPASIRDAWRTFVARKTNLALFALFLGLVMVAWVRLSALLFAIKFALFSPSIEGYLGILSGQGDPWVLAYFVGIGFVLAATVFITSAVAVPLIVDRDASPFTAIAASARAVTHNWPAMVVWAALIVILSVVGIATLFVGFIVLFPILGYATWHSYRAMLE
jgi:uncharacterized membrane protein